MKSILHITSIYMSLHTRKLTLWTLCKVSTRISLSMPHRLIRTDTFRLLWIFCFMNHYSIYLYPPMTLFDDAIYQRVHCNLYIFSCNCVAFNQAIHWGVNFNIYIFSCNYVVYNRRYIGESIGICVVSVVTVRLLTMRYIGESIVIYIFSAVTV